ncbi:acetyl-CoA C-acyltransferase [Geothermobacter hydrogeniphilus]|uniref:acetyl-CoA C-acyltransferase n=1 Tax=Geothermobacter hydrogeniphilus TaxID=1969733 RepID=A0A2K2H6U7_9BACT|nr:thiolase family protein [Geothermobacter hydrogeniphilus]PNU19036.1 acetyl-CoA C-acyltransferase [Geothermobacter hydrogeniphilus]
MNAYLIEARRTAIGRAHPDKGLYREVRADVLLAELMRRMLAGMKAGEELTAAIDDVYVGCVGQHLEQGKNIARLALLLAGLPETLPGTTVNRLCASSLQAFNFAASTIAAGHAGLLLAGGVEHMTHVPMQAATDYHQGLLDRYPFPFNNMGLTAEKVARDYAVSRHDQDAFAVESHRRALAAREAGHFAREILPIDTPAGPARDDQSPRPGTSLEALAELKTIFAADGSVTAGNSSPLNDGASLTLLASEDACKRFDLKPRARVVDFAVVGLDPCTMGMGPVPAIRALLRKTGLGLDRIDRFELNEAFASQALACIRELGLDPDKVNPWGGAIALGHPLGCTGTRLITTLLNGLEESGGRFGIASLCIGHGQGMATLIERL